MKPTNRLRSFLLGSTLLAAATTAHAQTWDGSSSGSWNTAANWNTPASVPGATAAIIFDGTGINLNTTTNAAFASINSITFTSGQTAAVNINTTAGASDMSTGTGLRFNPGTVFSVQGGNHTITGTGTSASTDRDITFNGTAAGQTYVFDIASSASLEIDARIGNNLGTDSDKRKFTKTGAGRLILSGENGGGGSWNFNNSTTGFAINGGAVRFAASGAVGNSGNDYTVAIDAAFELDGGFSQFINNGDVTLNGTGISSTGALRSISGNNTISANAAGTGTIILDSASSIGVDADRLTISKGISGSGTLTKVGAGELLLGSVNDHSYSGATTVSAGTLYVTGALANSAVTVQANGTLGSNGSAGTLGNGLTIDAGGDLDLTGATIALNSTNILSLTGTSSLTLGNLTFLDIVGWDWFHASVGTYELIDGGGTAGSIDFGSTAFVSEGTAYSFNGKQGYFTSDSFGGLNAVIIPEPSTALLGGLGVLLLLRRRR